MAFLRKLLEWWGLFFEIKLDDIIDGEVSRYPDDPMPTPPSISITERLAQHAEHFLGIDASPVDTAPDELGCVDSLTTILRDIYIDFPHLVSTIELKKALDASPYFEGTLALNRGCIILSVTGTGNGTVIGHTGILRGNHRIMSNTSKDGIWRDNYSVNDWVKRFRRDGGMKIYVYRPKEPTV